ncbi:hypothetical protein AB4P97_09235 [Pseudomonas sp. A1230]|uniref:hypothetical protein n=1 Tax=Pseudomonas sp. A1230 TaxID=3235106 RepID=UPI003783D9EB
MKTLNPNQHAILMRPAVLLAIILSLPMSAQAYTAVVEKNAIVEGEVVTGVQSIGADGTANYTLIEAAGSQSVFFKSVSSDALVKGRQLILSGTSNRSIISAGASQSICTSGVANNTILNGGSQTVQNRNSLANGTVINLNGM